MIERIGGDRIQLLTSLKEAEADGQLRREGTRAATRWFPAAAVTAPAADVSAAADDAEL